MCSTTNETYHQPQQLMHGRPATREATEKLPPPRKFSGRDPDTRHSFLKNILCSSIISAKINVACDSDEEP